MAINHKFSAFEEPFNFRGRVISLAEAPSGAPSGSSEEEAKAKIDAAKTKVEKSKFLKETSKSKEYSFDDEMIEVTDITGHILEKLEDADARDAEVITANIDGAIGKLTIIKAMRKGDLFTQEEYETALEMFDKAYEDFIFTKAELESIQKIREQASERIEARRTSMIATADSFREAADEIEGDETPGIPVADEEADWETIPDPADEVTSSTASRVAKWTVTVK